MDIEILRHHLERGVQLTQHAAGQQSALPVLSHLLLETDNGRLKFTATDLEVGVEVWVPCNIKKEGKITVPARTFSRFVSALQEEKVTLKTKKGSIQVQSGKTEATVKGLDADEFPIIPTIQKQTVATIPARTLATAFQSVSSFVSQSEVRPEITGVSMVIGKDGSLTTAATDSFRLAEHALPKKTAQQVSEDYSCILPPKAVAEYTRLFADHDEEKDITLVLEENQLLFQSETAQLITRLIEGTYPSYTKLIPNTTTTTATIRKNDLVEALNVSGVFTGTIQDITLQFNGKKDEVVVSGRDAEHGESTATVDGVIDGNDDVSITFNYRYLLEGLGHIPTEEVVVGVNDPTQPGVLKPTKKSGFLYIIMPIKVR